MSITLIGLFAGASMAIILMVFLLQFESPTTPSPTPTATIMPTLPPTAHPTPTHWSWPTQRANPTRARSQPTPAPTLRARISTVAPGEYEALLACDDLSRLVTSARESGYTYEEMLRMLGTTMTQDEVKFMLRGCEEVLEKYEGYSR